MARGSPFAVLTRRDFSGGWNPRDAWATVADNESPDMLNVTLDERGGVVKRLGLTRLNASTIVNTGNIQSMHYSPAIDRLIVQVGADLYVSTNGGTSFGASIKTFSTSERCHMVDFLSKVVIIHPTDRAFTYDGSSFSAAVANSPKGSCITAWQNALWSVGDASNPTRVTRSDLGAITWPGSPVTVDLRTKDDRALTCIGGGQGMDIQGRDGVLVFKEDSVYRIYDSSNGANSVIDYAYGASGPMCVTTNYGYTAALSRKGIILLPPGGEAAEYVSDRINTLFSPGQITFGNSSTMVAANWGNDRMVFSMPWNSSTSNSLTLEFSPAVGWFAPHSFGLSAATTYSKNTAKLYGGKVGSSSSDYGFLYDVFTSGADDSASIASRFQMRWFEPANGNELRFRRALINGRGEFAFYVKLNYEAGTGQRHDVDFTVDNGSDTWGGTTWGGGTWGGTTIQSHRDVYSLGMGRAISFEIQETSTLTATSAAMLDTGSAATVGAWGLYGVTVDMVNLGNT